MASKEMFSSPQEISLAISLGVLHFNQGFNSTYSQLAPELDIQVQPKMRESWQKIGCIKLIMGVPLKFRKEGKKREKKN